MTDEEIYIKFEVAKAILEILIATKMLFWFRYEPIKYIRYSIKIYKQKREIKKWKKQLKNMA